MRAGLIGDGGSDRALLPILRWLLGRVTPIETRVEWIDTTLFMSSTRGLAERVTATARLGQWDLLFIHRDAEGQNPQLRHEEISEAAAGKAHVAVVPIRMSEAWLLFDEEAIREEIEDALNPSR